MHRALTLAALMAAIAGARSARAAPTSRLVYSRAVDAQSCPDEQALRRAVAARVGYDPFFAWATRTIVAALTRHDQAFVATVDLIDEQGVSHGARELRGDGECSELLDAVALAIAIAIDPQSLSRPGGAPSPPPPHVPEPPPRPVDTTVPTIGAERDDEPKAPPQKIDHPAPVAIEASAAAVVSAGVAPNPSVGASLGAALRWSVWSIGVEGRIDAPATTSTPGGGEVSAWLLLAAIVPCAHIEPFFGCAILQGGADQAAGSGSPDARSGSAPWWAAGGRLGAQIPFSEIARVSLQADLVANVDRATLELNERGVWLAPIVATSVSVGVLMHFQ